MNHFRAIIIGAGPAGIAAAARLLENNINDIVVLEAENRIGGRVHTTQIGKDIVELGAEWIHGEKDNAVYELASKYDVADTNEMSETIFIETNFYELCNGQVKKDVSRELCNLYTNIVYNETSNVKEPKGSLGEFFMTEFGKGLKELNGTLGVSEDLAKKFIDVFEKWENSIDASDSWFETSLPGHLAYWECDGNVVTVWKGNGYRTLFDLLERKSPYGGKPLNINGRIQLNKEVSRIFWNKECVKGVPNVAVECTDGTRITSDYVISTLSLGVLKDRAHDLFSPELTKMKLNAINGLGFGTVDKIFLKFGEPWWTSDVEGFAFLWSDEERASDSSGWISDVIAFHPVRVTSTVLRGWIVGRGARQMESLTDEEVLNGCVDLFERFLGFKYGAIPRPECILRTRWYSNPHFRGSYSCRLLESDRRDVWASDLAEPECNALGVPLVLFAGEATHDHYFSTVHGAVETGRREADRLLKRILTSSNNLKDSYQVVIVGAGISGLAAAKTLIEQGITDVLVLEAQDAPGGRIRSVKVGDDWLELGAQWIHGDRNEVYEICREHDLVTDKYSQEGQGLYLREGGGVVDDAIVRSMDDFLRTALEECEEYVSGAENAPPSVGDEIAARFEEYLRESDESDEVKAVMRDLFEWHVRFHLIDNSCDDLSRLSAKAWGLFRFCGGNDYVNFKRGYASVIDAIVQEIPEAAILCSCPVDVIYWKETLGLERQMNGGGTCEIDSCACATVVCRNGVSIGADYVIVTSSLGYLKGNHKTMFRPQLPDYLTEAITSLGFGVLGKIFLIYDQAWWEPDVKGFQLVWSREKRLAKDADRHWSVDVTGFDVILDDRPILLGWVAGNGARTVEAMDEVTIGRESTELLQNFTGRMNVPLPQMVLKSNWYENEYVRGGYSHITVDYDGNGIDGSNLTIPVYTEVRTASGVYKKPTVLFAGEAAHRDHYSTVHGAYESGVSQARVIADDMKSKRR